MARQKKPTYEFVEKLGLYRKRIKDTDGKYFAIYGKTPDELTRKTTEAQHAVDDSRIARDNPTFSEYADRWTELNTNNISTQTKADYCYVINSHMKPHLGCRKIKEITPDDIKSAMLPLSSMSASVYNKAVMLYKKIFDSALENMLINRSPCSNLKRGGVKAAEKKALSNEQANILVDAVKGTVAYAFVMIGLYAGLRREEILGLKWDCVSMDPRAPHISVKRAVRWENNQPIVEERLKSAAAKRDIPIPPQLVECLQVEMEKSHSDFVISNTTGGPRSQIQFANMWGAVRCRMVGTRTYNSTDASGKTVKVSVEQHLGEKCKRHAFCYTIDFEVSPHILRHTYITNLFLSGMDIKTVQYLAGHATVDMTLNIYTHLTQNKPVDLIGQVKKAFEVKNEVNQSV